MEVVKNIAALLGVILSAASVLTLVSKTVRSAIAAMFRRHGSADELGTRIDELRQLLERHVEEEKELREQFGLLIEEERTARQNMLAMSEISMEFTREQCRNIIKNIFYKYNDTKILPLYEKKTLVTVEDIYVNRLGGNSYASLLIEEMRTWKIDYEKGSLGGD